MKQANGQIDWERTEEHAREMEVPQLDWAIIDAQNTLPASDALDREDGGNRGGYYRDAISVYRRIRAERTVYRR